MSESAAHSAPIESILAKEMGVVDSTGCKVESTTPITNNGLNIPALNLGSIEQIPPGHAICFIALGQEIAVFRQRDGRIFATQNRCPHRQGPLAEGIIGAGTVICPLHGHKFNLCSGAGNETQECIKTYPVFAHNGQILLQLSASQTVESKAHASA